MSQILSYYDETENKYKEVRTDQPLPVTAIGSGTGGAEEVEVTQPLPAGTNNIGEVNIATAAKGASAAGKPTSQAIDANRQGLDIIINTDGKGSTLSGHPTSESIDANTQAMHTAIAKALPAGTNNIGDVDIASVPDTNTDGTALPSVARTATTNSADLTNAHGKGVSVVLDVTAISGSASVTVKIQGKGVASGKYYDILTSAAVTAISTTIIKVHPGLTVAANSVANDIIPHTWRVVVTHANTDSIQYSAGYSIV